MIEIKVLSEDIENIRDLGITLLQNGYIYRLRKEGRFVIFEILNSYNDCIYVYKIDEKIDNGLCNTFRFSLGVKPVIEFKAFALKIY